MRIAYLRDHWQGRQHWLVVLVVNLVAVRVGFAVIFEVRGGGPLLVVTSLALLVWQVVGGARTAEREARGSGDILRIALLYGAMLAVTVVAVIGVLDAVASRTVPPAPAPPAALPVLEFDASAGVVTARGAIDYPMNTVLKQTVDANPSLAVVRFESDGGSIFAARAMAATISAAGLATRVEGHCYSACTIAFMAGAPRALGPDGALGFHGYRYDSTMRVQTLDIAAEEARDRAAFAAQGVEGRFLDRVFATAPGALWVPTRAELVAAGVIDR